MDATKKKSKVCRDEKQATSKLDEQIDKLIKTLGNSSTPQQKVAQLAKNYIELEREKNKQSTSLKQNEKVLEKEMREKEHLQREYNKGVLIRDKLEQVCREQQKLMKSIKTESMIKIRDEEEKRKETQAHFQKSINEIFATLGKNNDENLKIKEANAEMTKKFKYLAEQYELREKQLEKLNEQIKLETQLNEAKLAKVHMESTIEKEILLKEKQAALEEILASKKAIAEMETREMLLKEQLQVYTEKYDQFQDSLQKSNGVFATYKVEIEKMSKKTKLLDKEVYEWRSKYEKSNRALLNTISDKQAQDEYMKKSARQLDQLQKLCRTMQAERTVLYEVLKANNIERPPMPELPPEPKDIEPAPKPIDKLDVMTQNCKELKETLAQLQGQLNKIEKDDKQKGKNEAAGSKKAKPKKNKAKTGKNGSESLENGASKESEPSSTTADDSNVVSTSELNKTDESLNQVPVDSSFVDTTATEDADSSNKNDELGSSPIDSNATEDAESSNKDGELDSNPVDSTGTKDAESSNKIEEIDSSPIDPTATEDAEPSGKDEELGPVDSTATVDADSSNKNDELDSSPIDSNATEDVESSGKDEELSPVNSTETADTELSNNGEEFIIEPDSSTINIAPVAKLLPNGAA